MAKRSDLETWLHEALVALGGRGNIVDICRMVWRSREQDLRGSGDLFYTWQYDIRWAANRLRNSGTLKPAKESPSGIWELSIRPSPQ